MPCSAAPSYVFRRAQPDLYALPNFGNFFYDLKITKLNTLFFFFSSTDTDLAQGWGAPTLGTLTENESATPTSRRSSMSTDSSSRLVRGSIDERRARSRQSLDLTSPPGVRHVLRTDVAERNNTAKVDWDDIRDRSLSGYLS